MMKKIGKLIVLTLTFTMILGSMSFSVFAADRYEHKVTVSAGRGELSEDLSASGEDITASAETNGTTVTLGGSEAKITSMPDGKSPSDSKYFVTGLKYAGHDNETRAGEVNVKGEDADLVVAYGLKSNMVAYTVYYRDAATGNAIPGLPESEEFYGVAGSKPVISWRYADGYLPQTYNLTGTLGDGENEFTFWYYAVDAEGNVITVVDGVPAGAAAAAAAAAGGAAGAGVDGTTIGDGAVPLANGPQDTVDIDENQTPQSDPSQIDDNKVPAATWKKVGIGAGLIVVLAIAALLLAKRRKESESEE